jgi:hypothetical protein
MNLMPTTYYWCRSSFHSLTIDAVKFSNTISYFNSNAILNIKMYSSISLGKCIRRRNIAFLQECQLQIWQPSILDSINISKINFRLKKQHNQLHLPHFLTFISNCHYGFHSFPVVDWFYTNIQQGKIQCDFLPKYTQIQLQIILFLLLWDVLWIINNLLAPLSLFVHEFQQNSHFFRQYQTFPLSVD